MTTTVATGFPITRLFDIAGVPLGGGLLFTYQAGTSTLKPTYLDLAGILPNTNPIVLDTTGSAIIRYLPGQGYKLVLTDSTGVTVLSTLDNFYPPLMDAASIGSVLFPQTAAELAAGVTPTNYTYQAFDIRRYGADPTGAVASDAAFTSAIAVCGATGGTIRLPAGFYNFASQINLNQKTSIILQGDGSASGGGTTATRINYTGTTANPFISMLAAVGCQLRDMQISHSNAGFTGTYIKCGNTAGADPPFCGTFNCVIGSSVNGVGNVHLDLDKCILWTSQGCNFIYGNPSVKGMAASSYSNVIRFRDCHFYQGYVPYVNSQGQAWEFDSCTFEQLTTGAAGALVGAAAGTNPCVGLSVRGCWFGDVTNTAAAGTWIDGNFQGAVFEGNYISGNATSNNTTAFALRACVGVTIKGNLFSTLLTAINFAAAGNNGIVTEGNVANSVGTAYANTANIAVGQLQFSISFGFGVPSGHGTLANTGYTIHRDGSIEQWGRVSPATFGTQAITPFLIAFPNACYNVTLTLSGVVATTATIYASALTTTGFTYFLTDGTSTTDSFYWRAVGS